MNHECPGAVLARVGLVDGVNNALEKVRASGYMDRFAVRDTEFVVTQGGFVRDPAAELPVQTDITLVSRATPLRAPVVTVRVVSGGIFKTEFPLVYPTVKETAGLNAATMRADRSLVEMVEGADYNPVDAINAAEHVLQYPDEYGLATALRRQ